MSDLISREKALDAIRDADVFVFYDTDTEIDDAVEIAIRCTKKSVIDSINDLPSAESEVIRCKDCKHHVLHPRMGVLWCTLLHSDMGDNQFCSYAERRGEEE